MQESINFLTFEVARRVIMFHPRTQMSDGTFFNYDGDPNDAIEGSSVAETLLVRSPVGTRYQQSDGEQWFKKVREPSLWVKFATGEGESKWKVEEGIISPKGDERIDCGTF